jgi:hypothetical protein
MQPLAASRDCGVASAQAVPFHQYNLVAPLRLQSLTFADVNVLPVENRTSK